MLHINWVSTEILWTIGHLNQVFVLNFTGDAQWLTSFRAAAREVDVELCIIRDEIDPEARTSVHMKSKKQGLADWHKRIQSIKFPKNRGAGGLVSWWLIAWKSWWLMLSCPYNEAFKTFYQGLFPWKMQTFDLKMVTIYQEKSFHNKRNWLPLGMCIMLMVGYLETTFLLSNLKHIWKYLTMKGNYLRMQN